jgi:hypothetical protein
MRGLRFLARGWLGGRRGDLLVACALWALGFCVAASYMRTFNQAGVVADFLQPEFSAAVALACGKGFVNLGHTATPGLARFLARETDTFSCEELTSVRGGELTTTQRLSRYLMSASALVWALGGVSWSGLWPLFAVLFACVIASAYGLFRLGTGRLVAAAAALALVVSAIHLGHLPYLRDYAKAPFMLALLLVMARMATGAVTARRTIGYAVAFGLILGIGLGFRNDLLINVPAFFGVILLCLPGGLLTNLRIKAAAVGAAAAVFVAVGWPIVRGYGSGSNTGHVAFLGLMTPFDKPLGIRSSLYDWGYAYDDSLAANTINSYSHYVHGRVAFSSSEYDREAFAYLFQIARHWPADNVVRAYASALNILEMPFTVGIYTYSIPSAATGQWVAWLYGWQIWLLGWVSGRGVLVTAAALTIIGARSVRTALALLLCLLYYAGYPAIQFSARHFFHLEFIGWWALAFVSQQAGSLAWTSARWHIGALRTRVRPVMWPRPPARAVVFVIMAATLVAGGLKTLRAYQAPHVRRLFHEYMAAPKERVETTLTTDGDRALIGCPALWELAPDEIPLAPVRARYLVADFAAGAACDAVQLPVTFKYWYQDKTTDFSRVVIVRLQTSGKATRVFIPVYYNHSGSSLNGPTRYFEGVELPRRYADCLTALERITDPKAYSLLVDFTLAPGWEQATLFQTLTTVERAHRAGGPDFYTVPPELVVTRSAFADDVQSIANDVIDRAGIARQLPDGGWIAKGRAEGPQSSLLRFGDRTVPRHAVLVAEGELHRGRVSFNLLRAGQSSTRVSVNEPGPFVVALEAPDEGDFAVTVANDIVPWWPASRIGRRVGPLVQWIPGATLQTHLVLKRIGWATMDAHRAGAPVDVPLSHRE